MGTSFGETGHQSVHGKHVPHKSEATENSGFRDGAGITEFGNKGVTMNLDKEDFGNHAVIVNSDVANTMFSGLTRKTESTPKPYMRRMQTLSGFASRSITAETDTETLRNKVQYMDRKGDPGWKSEYT